MINIKVYYVYYFGFCFGVGIDGQVEGCIYIVDYVGSNNCIVDFVFQSFQWECSNGIISGIIG